MKEALFILLWMNFAGWSQAQELADPVKLTWVEHTTNVVNVIARTPCSYVVLSVTKVNSNIVPKEKPITLWVETVGLKCAYASCTETFKQGLPVLIWDRHTFKYALCAAPTVKYNGKHKASQGGVVEEETSIAQRTLPNCLKKKE